MAAERHTTLRAFQRRAASKRAPSASSREPERRIVRWIGAAKRRAARLAGTVASEPTIAPVIHLSWGDTFGRPARIETAGPLQAGGVIPLRPLPAYGGASAHPA
jgi:hypothetical protein